MQKRAPAFGAVQALESPEFRRHRHLQPQQRPAAVAPSRAIDEVDAVVDGKVGVLRELKAGQLRW